MRRPGVLGPVSAGFLLALGLVLAAAPARAREEIVIIRDLPAPAAPDTVAHTPGGIAAPAPASGLTWSDTPNDAGRSVALEWRRSTSDDGSGRLARYVIERAPAPGGPWTAVDSVAAGETGRVDASLRRDTDYFYRVTAVGPGGRTPALSVTGPVTARSEWFDSTRGSVLALLGVCFACILFAIVRAQEGSPVPVRRLAAIDALEPAVRRAGELGRPVLFIPGSDDIDELQTVAGLAVLEHVAGLAARAGTPLVVPVSHPLAHALAEESVKAGRARAGLPALGEPEDVRLVSPEQFAYVAAVTGIMARERPAAVFHVGAFHGESLLLAEAGAAIGATQIAATASVPQLPSFVATCDHTLIGEELFAAGAYLSGDARLLGSLGGADLVKVLLIVLIVVGCALESAGLHGLSALLATR